MYINEQFLVCFLLVLSSSRSASGQCSFPFTPENITYDYSSAAFQSIFAQLNRTVDNYLRVTVQNGVPYHAVAVVHQNRTIFTSGLTATPFRCASITKTFTALGALLLRERGRLSLDDPVKKFLPGYSIIDPFSRRNKPHNATLREVMAHVSGLPQTLCPFGLTCVDDEEEILTQIRGMELAVPPWSYQPVYSNLGFSILGHAWEKATSPRVSWWEFLDANVIRPLGMVNSGIDLTNIVLAPNLDPLARQDLGWSSPAAQMYSTAEDLAKYLGFLIMGNRSLISDASRSEWMRPTKLFIDGKNGYGLPWELYRLAANISSDFIITKNGNINGYQSHIALHQETQLGVVVLTVYNKAFLPGPDALANAILSVLIPQVEVLNNVSIAQTYDGVYTCATSPSFASPTLNYSLSVLGGSITVSSNGSRGLLASLSVNVQRPGQPAYVAGGPNNALLLKNETENSFWFGDGSACLWFLGGLSSSPDLRTPNIPESVYTNELRFDLKTQSVTWPAVGANCTKS